jgi:eukaryotic-like serine/threonine-protein kinase
LTVKGVFFGIFKYTALFFSLMLVGALSTFATLHFFTSGDEVSVPDLTGKDPVEAIQILNRKGLQLKILPQKRYSTAVAADRIVLQEPGAKTRIKQGRSIEVYLSLGPEKIIIPDLTGQTTRVARMMLEQYSLNPGKIIYVSSSGAQADQILAQFPLPGTQVTTVRTVNMLANSNLRMGPNVFVMPDVIGKPVSEVSDFFRQAGLRIGSTQAVDYAGITAGSIVKQSPPAGYKVTADSFISLYYSK